MSKVSGGSPSWERFDTAAAHVALPSVVSVFLGLSSMQADSGFAALDELHRSRSFPFWENRRCRPGHRQNALTTSKSVG